MLTFVDEFQKAFDVNEDEAEMLILSVSKEWSNMNDKRNVKLNKHIQILLQGHVILKSGDKFRVNSFFVIIDKLQIGLHTKILHSNIWFIWTLLLSCLEQSLNEELKQFIAMVQFGKNKKINKTPVNILERSNPRVFFQIFM